MGDEFQGMRMNEKEELKTLNSRFAGYINKVRALEQANKILEAQIEQLSAMKPTRVGDMYEDELARLRLEISIHGCFSVKQMAWSIYHQCRSLFFQCFQGEASTFCTIPVKPCTPMRVKEYFLGE